MAKQNDLLSIQDINSFVDRLRATVAAAEQNQALKAALAQLVSSSTAGISVAAGGGRGRKAVAKAPAAPGTKGRRGRQARVSNEAILELVKSAGGGISMRQLEAQLKQHPETIRLKLRDLRRQGLVSTTGPRNQLRYHAAGAKATDGAQAAAPAESAAATKAQKGGKRGRKAGKPGRKPKVAAKPAKPVKAAKPTKAAKGGKRGRKAAPVGTDGLGDKALGVIRGGGAVGVAMNTLAGELKSDPKFIRKAIEALVKAGSVKVTGNRRSTRYHAN